MAKRRREEEQQQQFMDQFKIWEQDKKTVKGSALPRLPLLRYFSGYQQVDREDIVLTAYLDRTTKIIAQTVQRVERALSGTEPFHMNQVLRPVMEAGDQVWELFRSILTGPEGEKEFVRVLKNFSNRLRGTLANDWAFPQPFLRYVSRRALHLLGYDLLYQRYQHAMALSSTRDGPVSSYEICRQCWQDVEAVFATSRHECSRRAFVDSWLRVLILEHGLQITGDASPL